MASIVREITVNIGSDVAWAAVRDVAAVPQKLVPGLVSKTTVANGVRHVVFLNGLEIDERIVTIDDKYRRVVYAVQGRASHHQASMQVIERGGGQSQLVWITDVLPDEAAERFAAMMDQAIPIIKRTLETDGSHT